MFVRTVSLILVAAVIACPLWCGNGSCHADSCCSAEQSTQQACPVHATACCCCDNDSSDSNDNCPCEAPCESSCQGICGGAVFEKPCGLNDGMDSSFLSLLVGKMPIACRLAECRIQNGDHFILCGGNHGRILRTLHMSFLC